MNNQCIKRCPQQLNLSWLNRAYQGMHKNYQCENKTMRTQNVNKLKPISIFSSKIRDSGETNGITLITRCSIKVLKERTFPAEKGYFLVSSEVMESERHGWHYPLNWAMKILSFYTYSKLFVRIFLQIPYDREKNESKSWNVKGEWWGWDYLVGGGAPMEPNRDNGPTIAS